jgi:D-alanyl-D-alanine carboxypeptidase
MRIFFSLSAFLIGFLGSIQSQIDPNLATQLQQILNQRVLWNGDHGVSACVIMPDGSVWNGYAGVGAGEILVSDSMVFHGASTMKMNIAVLMVLLDEEGIIDLDESWDTYVDLDVAFSPEITIRQLIGNRSGIADYLEIPGSGNYVTSDFDHQFTPQEILEDIVSEVPDFAPGTEFWYSTSNFVLAAYIINQVTGNSMEQELRSRIWEPLGMSHTYFGGYEVYTEPKSGVWWNFGSGINDYSMVSETSMLSYGYGGANMVSTPGDLAKFVRAVVGGTFLSESAWNQMIQFSPDSYDDWSAGYGLGIHNANAWGNNSVLGHDGYFTNMTDMFHSLDYGFTLVTMTNTQTGWFAIFDDMYEEISAFLELNVHEVDTGSSIEIFPNPCADVLNVKSKNSFESNAIISIIDSNGRQVVVQNSPSVVSFMSLDISDLPSGIYTLVFTSDQGQIVRQRWVKSGE